MLLGDPGVLISSEWGMDTQFHFWQISQNTYIEFMLVSHFYAGFCWAAVDRQYLSSLRLASVKLILQKALLCTLLNQQLAFPHGQCFASWIHDGFDLTRYFKAGFVLVSNSIIRHSFWQVVNILEEFCRYWNRKD